MLTIPAGARIEPLMAWTALHPAALAAARGEVECQATSGQRWPRSARLAEALAASNRRWGADVSSPLADWLGGADAVVTGQQPGLLGGPLLTLIKACAVAAEVARRRAAGRPAVGFLWLATADDDLPEMGWARVPAGEELLVARAAGWTRGSATAGATLLGDESATLLDTLEGRVASPHAAEVLAMARRTQAAGTCLGEATARLLGAVLSGTGVVLVDSLDPELARAGAESVTRVLADLPAAWDALGAGLAGFARRGWPAPLRLARHKLPVFRLMEGRRESIATGSGGSCPSPVRDEFIRHPERFVPNVWLRPLLQDAALDPAVSVLGGAELAYHLVAADLRSWAGAARPEWRLRPHVTVVTAAERRLARQIGCAPADLLRRALPVGVLPGAKTRASLRRLRATLDKSLAAVGERARAELPGLAGDFDATARKLESAVGWLEQRAEAAATRGADTEVARWRRLRTALRPDGAPQERHLSAITPLLRLGLEWPAQLIRQLDPGHPGMHLLNWEEGGEW